MCHERFRRLFVHVKHVHKMTYEQYIISTVYGGEAPVCMCGCGEKITLNKSVGMSLKKYVNGHNAKGSVVSEQTRKAIGAKNKVKMKEYHALHPELADVKRKQLMSGVTQDVILRRNASIRKTWQDLGLRHDRSVMMKNLWKIGHFTESKKRSDDTLRKHISDGTSFLVSKEHAELMSKRISAAYISRRFTWKTGTYNSTKMNDTFRFRSSWELRHMKALDADISVLSWLYESFRIPYVWEGKMKHYVPDFLVTFADGHHELQEVGVKKLKNVGKQAAKSAAGAEWARQNNASFRVVSDF